ncbi:MAG: hypothetical protein KGS09_17855 [Nitrospirae bacterium]|nr:hypothetical protein [Nitrospirota bacterium]MBU6482394.1 hypothetical protein [Nitrospirota bacterium]MDE3040001.1 hypothetical protein [Nitrospirota bacterium]MDE3051925.1 hypothetical protein [Nitrospirota bacterium]MDE3219704.1 hypothetical protein [Nitrospirota bacterium]
MNTTKAGLRFGQRMNLLVLLTALAVFGVAILQAAPPSNELLETVPEPIGKELAVTGEVVMIEGNVQIVEDPSGAKKDAYLIMDHLYVAQVIGDKPTEFLVNEKTRMDEDIKVGDKVEVLAAQNGEALSIKKAE